MPSQDATLLATLTAELREQDDEIDLVRTMLFRAAELVPDTEHASLAVRAGGRLTTLAWSSAAAAELDGSQTCTREGPTVEVLAGRDLVRSGDAAHESRWQSWGPRAASAGGRSVCSIQLPFADAAPAALTLYSSYAGRFGDRDQLRLTALYGLHAGTVLGAARVASNLRTAIETRHTIGAAQGIIMKRFGLRSPPSRGTGAGSSSPPPSPPWCTRSTPGPSSRRSPPSCATLSAHARPSSRRRGS